MELLVKDAFTMNDGHKIPVQGFGVFKISNEETAEVVKKALGAGLRLIDTAQAYENEEGVGKGVAMAGLPREDLFITTKVWNRNQGRDKTLASFKDSLRYLGTDYVDLLLIHWPLPHKGLYVETYETLVELQKQGLCRSIGVSNFNVEHLQALEEAGLPTPALNQIELHPYLLNAQVAEYCKARHIAVQAWSPLAKNEVLADPVIAGLAAKKQRTPAQIVLRWDYQNGVLTIPKSANVQRNIENADIFGFELAADEMAAINALDQKRRTGPDPLTFDRE